MLKTAIIIIIIIIIIIGRRITPSITGRGFQGRTRTLVDDRTRL